MLVVKREATYHSPMRNRDSTVLRLQISAASDGHEAVEPRSICRRG
jgi:hypothetical protein